MLQPKDVTSTGHLSRLLNSFERSLWYLLHRMGIRGRGLFGDFLRLSILENGFILLLLRGR